MRARAQGLPGHATTSTAGTGSRATTAGATSTPLFLCLAAIVAADIAFAVDSIPAAFAITRDSVLIWMGNVFALLGLRALFVLVEGLIRRFRYLDETIAVVLALVAVKLLIEDLYKIGPVGSLAIVAAAFAIGIVASLIGRPARPGRRRQARGSALVRTEDVATPPSSRSWRSTSASTSSGSLPRATRRALRATHQLADLLAQAGVDGRRGQARELGLDVDRRLAAARRGGRCGPPSIWRISSSRSPRST